MEEKYNTEIKLSVALCTYNGAKFLREQFDSIAAQTVKVDEVIACDDSSSDDTVSILREYADKGILPIQIVENNRQLGVIANFEQAILACTGDIIFCSDQDDIWMPYKTKVIKDYFDKHPAIDFVFSDAELIGANGEKLTDKTLFDTAGLKSLAKMWDAGLKFEITNTIGNHTSGCTMALRKSMTQYAFPLTKGTDIIHDYQLVIAAIKNNSIGTIYQCLIKYRLHTNNTCGIGDNWVLNNRKEPDWMAWILQPAPLHEFKILTSTPIQPDMQERMAFQSQRNACVKTFKGRVRLLLSLDRYVHFYKQYFYLFYIKDLFIGIPNHIKKKFKWFQ